tara:strand:+ start:126 stop:380 length:255 start_codon:yes stop_codon:yes gene_type:complete
MTNNEIIKKQLIYRSTHRGTKEMDLLLGNFVRQNIDSLNKSDLVDLKYLLDLEDEILQDWYNQKTTKSLIPINKISKMFKKFKI